MEKSGAHAHGTRFVDTHAHYNMPAFAGDLPTVIDSIRAAGVGKVICPAVSYASNAQMLTSLAGIPDMYFALGIHPKLAYPRGRRWTRRQSTRRCTG